ncbi:bifunctional serine/threonine-protein kinase/formylglycine-generating enzyme family protein [Acaryochloris marina]|uniref:bifunctional serine/threonine-protein kinase/formylglycine-generating enzyme family protein n=1 Tax=Acaryochloris marina TaxID=155978 RepID=UPI002016CE86|nr:SUMF1/EgtB/PvdO family nonheme iron enzyme [Acaryochloris marina]
MLCCLNPDCEKPINQETDKFCQSCGTELISLLRHRYKIVKPLGQGGFGKTYLAEDTDKLQRPCVVKQLFYQGQSSNANQKIVQLFMREAEQLDQLKANQQIPDLLAYFEEDGFLYLVQEYIDGQDLLKELQQEGPLSEAKIEALLLDLLPVLAFIHEKGVVHRDLKPENIMRRKKDGRLMLIDFGVARQISMSQLTVTGTKVGSPGYFSVEQFAEGKATGSSDLYSIGATSFHLLTGQYPGELWTMQGYGWVNNWQEHLPHAIDSKLSAIINKLLQIKAEDRYQTANEVLSDLAKNPDPETDSAENLRQYEAELRRAIRSVYPLDDYVREGLKQLQQSLGLLDAEVARIEQPILKQAEANRQEQLKQQLEAQRQTEARQQEQLRQEAETQRQEQLKQQALVRKQAQQTPTPSPLSPVLQKKNRRQFLTLAAFGSVGLGSVLVWEIIKNSQRDLTTSESPSLDLGPLSESPSPDPSPSSESASSLKSFEYEVVSVDETGAISNRSQKQAQFFAEELDSSTTLEMVKIPGGTFTMGSLEGKPERDDDEGPQHEVTLSLLYLGKYPVTQAQWEAIMGSNPSKFKGANRPVEKVSWNDAVEFCQKLSQKHGKDYRLPSEAEWEYACRGETTTPFYFGETITTDVANYRGTDFDFLGKTIPGNYASGPKGEYREQTTDVGSFPPNTFGLYDMHGTIWEWCQDTWHDNYTGAPTDGSAWVDDKEARRITRGGSWIEPPGHCRSASRGGYLPSHRINFVGFRVALLAPRILQ